MESFGCTNRTEGREVRLAGLCPTIEADHRCESVAVREATGPHGSVGCQRARREDRRGVLQPTAALDKETVDGWQVSGQRHFADDVGPEAVDIEDENVFGGRRGTIVFSLCF